jgi:mono/diheme cytochrome c family protein
MRIFGFALVVALVVSGGPSPPKASARLAEARLAREGGRTSAQQRTIWDGVYSEEQAARGEKVYAERCSRCHGDGLQGVEAAPALSGTAFYSTWEGETLEALFERMRSSMPQDAPGSLSRAQNTELLAHMLRVGGYPAGKTALETQAGALAGIRILMYRP